ncbi:MAG: hypothetical protein L3K09_07600 [Thermoplasmata archaeon]|nr:hypothetical protein [Thermoplasmata archaeon]
MASGKLESLSGAVVETLSLLGTEDPNLSVIESDDSMGVGERSFAQLFPARFRSIPGDGLDALRIAIEDASKGSMVVVSLPPGAAVRGHELLGRAAARGDIRLTVLCAARPTHVSPGGKSAGVAGLNELELLRSLPRIQLVVPPDAPTAQSVIRCAAASIGVFCIQLAAGSLPVVSDGRFELGRARLLRPGGDLTIAAIGSAVALALDAAVELEGVGVHARVLDLVSLKPFDVKALVRAAGETGAILTVEPQNAVAGIGALVASTTSESQPVPVRRLGAPDLEPSGATGASGEPWLTRERLLEEAWELLRMKGKVQ